MNTAGSYTCGCPTGFQGNGQSANGCLLTRARLLSLVPSSGALNTPFDSETTTYTLALPVGTTSVFLTPTVSFPSHSTISVDGSVVASGAKSTLLNVGFLPRTVSVTVTTDGGQSWSYFVSLQRSAPTYLKASNTDAKDEFGSAIALSADGSTLAVGVRAEASSATGVSGGGQSDNSTPWAGAVYVFTRVGAQWHQEAYLKASNTDKGDYFGSSVALSADGSNLAVGAPGEASKATGINGDQADNSASSSGAVYVFTRAGSQWGQQAYVKASNTRVGAGSFGGAVALSSDGSTLAVGAIGESSKSTGINGDQADISAAYAGAAYVFVRTGSQWSQQAYVKASNTEAYDYFGGAVALSADGSTLAVGANGEDSAATGVNGDQSSNSASYAGAVYVFSRSGTAQWGQQAYVKAFDTAQSDNFGAAIVLSADGSTLAVGASGKDRSVGRVCLFARSNSQWNQQADVKASNAMTNDNFGGAIALSADGLTLAVGATGEDSMAIGVNGNQDDDSALESGAIYIFGRVGVQWTQQTYIKAPNTGAGDHFGTAVALTADGSGLAVGALWEDSKATGINGDMADNSLSNAGAVYVY